MALKSEPIQLLHMENARNAAIATKNAKPSESSENKIFINKCTDLKEGCFTGVKELCLFSNPNLELLCEAPLAYIDEELSGSEHDSLESTNNAVIDCTNKRVGVFQPERANISVNVNKRDVESDDLSARSNNSGADDTSFAKTSSLEYPVEDATFDISTISSMESPVENWNAESLTVTEKTERCFGSIESPPCGNSSPARPTGNAPETRLLVAAGSACDGLQCLSEPTRVDITPHACLEHVPRLNVDAESPQEEQRTYQCKSDARPYPEPPKTTPSIVTNAGRPTPGEWSPVPPRHGASEENESASCRSWPKATSTSKRKQEETICDTIKLLESTLDATIYDPWKNASRHEYNSTTINFESSKRLKRLEERLNSRKQLPVIGNASTQTEDSNTNLLDIELIPPPPPPKEYAEDNSESTIEELHVTCVITADQVLIGDVYTNCEFDAREINNYALPLDEDSYYECYDELGEEEGEEEAIDSEKKESAVLDSEIQHQVSSVSKCKSKSGDARRGPEMVHNRDHGNLRSLLKKAGSSGSSASSVSGSSGASRNKRRVVFDEKRNEFFDADYIILIREDCAECRYDEDDEDGQCSCTCGDHEPLPQCPGCCDDQCEYDDHSSQTPQSPKFAPPLEFVDQAALSPPEGYKDGGQGGNGTGPASALGALGAQHLHQLQVIQRLQEQRQYMLATAAAAGRQAAAAAAQQQQQQQLQQNAPPARRRQLVCAECRNHDSVSDSDSPSSGEDEDMRGGHGSPQHSRQAPEYRPPPAPVCQTVRPITMKEIVAGEERPVLVTNCRAADETKSKRYIVETVTMTAVTERRIVREASGEAERNTGADVTDSSSVNTPGMTNLTSGADNVGASLNGILKGGRLWKSTSDLPQEDSTSFGSDDDNASRRSVRFFEENDNTLQSSSEVREDDASLTLNDNQANEGEEATVDNALGNYRLVGSGSTLYTTSNILRPNSAVRQLFPTVNEQTEQSRYLVTSDNLKAFDESKRTRPLATVSKETDEEAALRRTIERNTLRRSLIKYEPKRKQQKQRETTSLEERIRQLTCVDDDVEDETKPEERDSPSGEEASDTAPAPISKRNSYSSQAQLAGNHMNNAIASSGTPISSFSPCSSSSISSTSSSSNSSSSAYRKITELFTRKSTAHEKIPEANERENDQENPIVLMPQGNTNCKCPSTAPDLGNGQAHQHMQYTHQPGIPNHNVHPLIQAAAHASLANRSSSTSESRKQFLSSLAPLTACVSANHHAMGNRDDYYYQLSRPGERISMASSGTQCSEYSLGDIDEALMKANASAPSAVGGQQHDGEQVAPDVIAGTPGTPGSQEIPVQDELAAFVQQDASRIERIKKRYGAQDSTNMNNLSGSDDEHDDYGFNRRPSVRGIKPRFGSTTEILQQMQTQLQSPPSTLTKNQHVHPTAQHQTVPMQKQIQAQGLLPPGGANAAAAAAQQQAQWYYHYQDRDGNHRHSYHQEENVYQNIYDRHHHYGIHHPHYPHQHHPNYTAARSPSRGRSESPPPLRNYHQTMVLIPYNNSESGYVQQPHYSTNEVHSADIRMHDNRIPDSRYRRSYPMMEYHHQQQSLIQVGQQMIRLPIPNNANALPPGNVGTGYASPSQVQLHLVTGTGHPAYPMRYSGPQRQYSDSPPGRNQQPQYANTADQQQQLCGDQTHEANKYSTLTKYPERGVPEGAAAIASPPQQDGYTVTSPTGGSQTNIAPATDSTAPVFYAMNV